jgi:hypothetical protein
MSPNKQASIIFVSPILRSDTTSSLLPIRQPKEHQTIGGNDAQRDGDRLAQLDGARHRGASQHGRRDQPNLLAVRLAVTQSDQREQVERADGEAGGD